MERREGRKKEEEGAWSRASVRKRHLALSIPIFAVGDRLSQRPKPKE